MAAECGRPVGRHWYGQGIDASHEREDATAPVNTRGPGPVVLPATPFVPFLRRMTARRPFGVSLARAGSWMLIAVALQILALQFMRDMLSTNKFAADAWTYLAAGERLNAGHDLYALTAGDRWVEIKPPYWTVPLLSPPFIAVVWRPLAVLGDPAMFLWWAATGTTIVLVIVGLLARIPARAALAILVLSPAISFELGVANVNGFLLGGMVATWLLARDGRHAGAGVVVALMAAVKLAPAILVVWFVAQRRWSAVTGFALASIGLLLVSLAGAGLEAHVRYLTVIRETQAGGLSDLSIAGLLLALGVPNWVAPFVTGGIVLFGLLEVFALRHRPRLAFSVVVLTMILGSPVVNLNTLTLMLAALAPVAWPRISFRQSRTSKPSPVQA